MMKLSEAIKQLQVAMYRHGDFEIVGLGVDARDRQAEVEKWSQELQFEAPGGQDAEWLLKMRDKEAKDMRTAIVTWATK